MADSSGVVERDEAVDVRPAGERFHTVASWLDSWHSFSFGGHHDPSNTHHGLLLVNNEDVIAPGGGFGEHPHRDMEIVTWVLRGELLHRDSTGGEGVIYPGLAQFMRAGTGIRHSEMNASATADVHVVQMWAPPGRRGLAPGYEQRDVSDVLAAGGLVAVAAGPGGAADAALAIDTPGTTLWAVRLGAGASAAVPDAPRAHLFVALGGLELEPGTALGAGDAARLSDAGTRRITAGNEGAEVLLWVTPAALA
ncbi:MAG: pirin family protein [Acidimicrobiia bacterium]|nr:pirin family protein [Acidimicrobiia bacterium]